MRPEIRQIADVLVDKIERDFRNDVALVHLHGSLAFGETHDLSDLDLYFVPKTPRGHRLACAFILNGIGCDLWAIPWERLEHIASHGERATAAIFMDGEVAWHGDEADLARFMALRARAMDKTDKAPWLERARKALEGAYRDGFRLARARTLAEARTHAILLLNRLSFVLAQLNQAPVRRGRRHLKTEILAMPQAPRDFGRLHDAIFWATGPEAVIAAGAALLQDTEALVTAATQGPARPFREVMLGWFEEMCQFYNKIAHACATGDALTPLFAGAEFSAELAEMLALAGTEASLPDLVAAYDPGDLGKMAAVAAAHRSALGALLRDKGLPPLEFTGLDQVRAYLDSR